METDFVCISRSPVTGLEACVGKDYTNKLKVRKVQAFCNHLSSKQNIIFSLTEFFE